MNVLFYLAGAVAIVATLRVVTCAVAIHALLYLIVALLATGLVFFSLGAPFVAALEVILYAGAIMVLFVFVVMMIGQDDEAVARERAWIEPGIWIGPGVLALVLGAELAYAIAVGAAGPAGETWVGPREVGTALYGPYVLALEVAGMMLLAGLVGAYHIGRRWDR